MEFYHLEDFLAGKEGPVVIENLDFNGKFYIGSDDRFVEQEVIFRDCHFRDSLNISGTFTFPVVFKRCTFQEVCFFSTIFLSSFHIHDSVLHKELWMKTCNFEGVVELIGNQYHDGTNFFKVKNEFGFLEFNGGVVIG